MICTTWNRKTGVPCEGEAEYAMNGSPICAECARRSERALLDGTLKYMGHTPARGEVIIRSLGAQD